jgi:hypothetical protein
MSYSLLGFVITQDLGTTNADLSGLASIAGVTVFDDGIRKLYILDGLQLKLYGTQTINPFTECIFTQNWSAQYNVINYGNLTINGYRNYYGADQYSKQPWLISSENDNNYCFQNNSSGTLSWTGGAIHSRRGVSLEGSVTLDTIIGDGVHVNRFQFQTSSLTINGSITLQGFRCSLGNNEPISNLTMTGARGIDFSSTAGRENVGNGLHYVLTDYIYKLSNNGCNIRYFNTADFINTETGSELDVNPQAPNSTSNNNGGVVAVYKKIKFNVKDLSGNNLQGAKIYFYTYDDGNRVDVSSSFGAGFDFSGTDIFSLTTDASGNTATSQVLLVAHTLPTTNTDDLNVSYYSKNGDTTDLYTVDYYKYGFLKSQLDVSMKGTGEKTQDFVGLPDLSISEPNKSTVDAYTEIDTSNKFYDRAAAYLEDNFGSYTVFLVSRSGNQIDAGAYNVTINATAAAAFAITGNTITIKAGTFTGDMVTTGVITLANGALFVGSRTDANGTVTVTTLNLTGLKVNTEVRIFEAGTTTELGGVENSGTSFAINISESSVDLVLMSLGYIYQRIESVDTSANLTLPIQQIIDRNYSNE